MDKFLNRCFVRFYAALNESKWWFTSIIFLNMPSYSSYRWTLGETFCLSDFCLSWICKVFLYFLSFLSVKNKEEKHEKHLLYRCNDEFIKNSLTLKRKRRSSKWFVSWIDQHLCRTPPSVFFRLMFFPMKSMINERLEDQAHD